MRNSILTLNIVSACAGLCALVTAEIPVNAAQPSSVEQSGKGMPVLRVLIVGPERGATDRLGRCLDSLPLAKSIQAATYVGLLERVQNPGEREGYDLVVLVDADPSKIGAQNLSTAYGLLRDGGGLLAVGLPRNSWECCRLDQLLGDRLPVYIEHGRTLGEWAAEWIWYPAEPVAEYAHRYFRKSFEIPAKPSIALLRISADNIYHLYVNGELVGTDPNWTTAETYDLTACLSPGRNVIAIDAHNVDGPAGVLAQMVVKCPGQEVLKIGTGRSWRVGKGAEDRWRERDFDDSRWAKAKSFGKAPIEPWSDRVTDCLMHVSSEVKIADLKHAVTRGIPDRLGKATSARRVKLKSSAGLLARAKQYPAVVAGETARGRSIVVVDSGGDEGSFEQSDFYDDLIRQAVKWLTHRQTEAVFDEYRVPEAMMVGETCRVNVAASAPGAANAVVRCLITKGPTTVLDQKRIVRVDPRTSLGFVFEPPDTYAAEGDYRIKTQIASATGTVVALRDSKLTVRTRANVEMSIRSGKRVTAPGFRMDIDTRVVSRSNKPTKVRLEANVLDRRDLIVGKLTPREIMLRAGPEQSVAWHYDVPNVSKGDYRIVSRLTDLGAQEVVDESVLDFQVTSRINLRDFFSTTVWLSRFHYFDKAVIAAEIDDMIAHGFNTLSLTGGHKGVLDFAEEYAQMKGMAISYCAGGAFSLLHRGSPPAVCVYSPEYPTAVAERAKPMLATCRSVPRLLYVLGYADEPFNTGEEAFCYCEHCQRAFREKHGVALPRTNEIGAPKLWRDYLDFRARYWPHGWEQSYKVVKDAYPDFWVELTHDSHNTFGAAAGPTGQAKIAVEDVFHWGAAGFDSVNFDIYPYLSTDFRSGKYGDLRKPRMSQFHFAFAQMRDLSFTYDKRLSFWVESISSEWRMLSDENRVFHWSPRELSYTAIAHGCDHLTTGVGIPEDPKWWQTMGETMREVQTLAPVLLRSRKRKARAGYLFPRTQHLMLQEEYWNVGVAYELFLRAFGELDCLHEMQVAEGALSDGAGQPPGQRDRWRTDVLALFDVSLLPGDVANEICEFVGRGGVLMADQIPHLNEDKEPSNVLQPLFRAQQTGDEETEEVVVEHSTPELGDLPAGTRFRVAGARHYEAWPGAEVLARFAKSKRPAIVKSRYGKGTALLFCFNMKESYFATWQRPDPRSRAALRTAIRSSIAACGIQPNVFSSNPDIEATVAEGDDSLMVFVINHESKVSATSVKLHHLPFKPTFVSDLLSGRAVDFTVAHDALELTFDVPFGGTSVLGVYPDKPARGHLTTGEDNRVKRGESVTYKFALENRAGGPARGNHLFSLSVRDPRGLMRPEYSGMRCTSGGFHEGRLLLPVNALTGEWTVTASDPVTRQVCMRKFVVR